MAAVPPEGEETSEPPKCQTWVLKVSIHCEGCKRKVKRILHSVHGVYNVDVDAKQHKVTVTGNVDSNTLIKKLEKSGKHAELWPDSQKNPGKSKKNRDPCSQNPKEQPQNQANHNKPTAEGEKVAVNAEERPQKNAKPENSNSGNDNTGNNRQEQVKEARFDGNIPDAANEKNPPEKHSGENTGGEKKKKKGHKGSTGNAATTTTDDANSSNNGESVAQPQQPNGVTQRTESPPPPPHPGRSPDPYPDPNPSPDSMSPPRHPGSNRAYEYPPAYYTPAPPAPVYGVSYSTAYPSYTASYYSEPPPYSYAYVHGAVMEPPPPSDWNSASSQPSDTFEMFSDENPNACSVM